VVFYFSLIVADLTYQPKGFYPPFVTKLKKEIVVDTFDRAEKHM